MRSINDIYEAIDANGFKESTLQLIDGFINDIENGRTNFSRFNEQEHAGLCKAGAPLIGASIIASYARRSITASCLAEGREGGPANWEIDEKQEQLIGNTGGQEQRVITLQSDPLCWLRKVEK